MSVEPVESVFSPRAPDPVGPYPHAKRVGDLLFVSGVGPRQKGQREIPGVTRDERGEVIAHDIEIQARSCFENVRMIVEDAGSSMERVVDVLVFLTHLDEDFERYNRVFQEFFGPAEPARTTVEVTRLPTPIAIELKVIATI